MKLFDFDGTLADSNGVWEEIDVQFLSRRGLTPTREYSDRMGHSIFPIAARITRDYYRLDMTPEAIMAEWLELGREAYERHIPLKPGAGEFLARCAARGERMALVTACVPQLCRAALERHGLTNYFQDVVFVEELCVEKREPRAFTLALERLGAAPGECTLYEDSPAACAAAKQAGLTVVGVYDPFYAMYEGEMRKICDQYIGSFAELLAEQEG